ncbi:cellulose biosynthesis protein BcsE [Vibrio sp. S17_S38]|uniref:cellulose biosynthesis protein BcsE n=1 Tax=Vibrio sp. S17_S38 TaxID=2720229 RepID=UPI00168011F4|nr:cellulose biosynthesis protein BcsE [Vibrio sp. S17_S38]MBD1574112.1 cellulose biosynthesis protein BcsE [Vibrio sp. S17_S38]
MFGIVNLHQKHQVTATAGLYALTTKKEELSNAYIKTLLESSPDCTFVSFRSLEQIFNNKDRQKINALKELFSKQNTYFLSKNKESLSLTKLIKDFNKITTFKKQKLVILLPDSHILMSNELDRQIFFSLLKKFSHDNKLLVSIIIQGQESHIVEHWLTENPEYFLGLTSIHQVDLSKFIYQIHYWISGQSISTNYEYDILFTDAGVLTVDVDSQQNDTDSTQNLHDNRFLYIVDSAIDTNQSSDTTMVTFTDNQNLFDTLKNITSGTVILTIHQQTEIHLLALNCYRLRRQFGYKFKIVLREMQQCLRYSDETFLAHAGINLIVPANVRYARFLSMVETLQKQDITTNPVDTVESLLSLETNTAYGYKGYVDNQRFAERCYHLIQQYEHNQLQFALIKLSLLPGMNINTCLSMSHIKREGDLITACSDALYVLLSSVRHNDVQIALSHIFNLPIMDIFQSHTIYTTTGRMKDQLPEIITNAVIIDENSAQLSTQHSIFSSNEQNTASSSVTYATHKPIEV